MTKGVSEIVKNQGSEVENKIDAPKQLVTPTVAPASACRHRQQVGRIAPSSSPPAESGLVLIRRWVDRWVGHPSIAIKVQGVRTLG